MLNKNTSLVPDFWITVHTKVFLMRTASPGWTSFVGGTESGDIIFPDQNQDPMATRQVRAVEKG